MKIKEGFLMREVAGSYVVVPVGGKVVDFSAMITTNETGAFLWNLFKDGSTIENAAEALTKEYDVDIETAKNDTLEFVEALKQKKVFED